MISLRHFSYRFEGSDRAALIDVTLDIAPGDFVVITGPSGSGKSTLALAMSGFLFSQYAGEADGEATVDGVNVRETAVYRIAEIVGLVQQNPEAQFCTLTVQDEVAFGLENRCLPREEIRERLAWALEVVGAAHLGDRALSTLSGGEKQRVAVASMLAAKPHVLIFDEPTSNLDPTATQEIFDVIARVREIESLTIIVLEHKVDYLRRFSPRWISMDAGRASESTRPPESFWRSELSGHVRSARSVSGEPVARVDDLVVGYDAAHRDGEAVLHGISLSVAAGEFVVLMGNNGSGKSTLLHCLMGFLKPYSGCVEVVGSDTRRVPVSQLARDVGYLFQNPDHQLFADTVWDEAVLALRNFGLVDSERERGVKGLVERAGLGGRETDPPYRLSYGQKRRLNLISVIGHGPRLLLLDELLIGQDPVNATFLLGLLRDLADRGTAVLLVSHAPEVAALYADRVVYLEEGRVTVDAPPQAAFARLELLGQTAFLPAGWEARS
jgi:energy-coupling factor transport system ATP-binding protein